MISPSRPLSKQVPPPPATKLGAGNCCRVGLTPTGKRRLSTAHTGNFIPEPGSLRLQEDAVASREWQAHIPCGHDTNLGGKS
jgi:hypothetical protein